MPRHLLPVAVAIVFSMVFLNPSPLSGSQPGPSLIRWKMLDGSGNDVAYGIAIDSHRNVYVTGSTSSSDISPLHAVQPYNRSVAPGTDAFVAKLDAAGKLLYFTYLGGTGNDEGRGIAVGSDGCAYVTGWTESDDFPVVNGFQATRSGGKDAFVVKLSPEGDRILFSTYLGGEGNDEARGIAIKQSGEIYIAGTTESRTFPLRHALQRAFYSLKPISSQ